MNKRRAEASEKPRQPVQEREDLLEGRNSVAEALKAGRTIDKVFAAAGDTDSALLRLTQKARAAGAVICTVDRRKLDAMSVTHAHQGIIALVAAHSYATLPELLENARKREQAPLLVLCDNLSDPYNLGALIRTAECAGAHGVVIPKRHSVSLTASVAKASAGALEYLPVARVSNMSEAIRYLQQNGVWVVGTAADGAQKLSEVDMKGPTAIVIGSEGEGMSRLVKERCDYLVSIPMFGHVSSLNASAAAAILLYEAVRQRI